MIVDPKTIGETLEDFQGDGLLRSKNNMLVTSDFAVLVPWALQDKHQQRPTKHYVILSVVFRVMSHLLSPA